MTENYDEIYREQAWFGSRESHLLDSHEGCLEPGARVLDVGVGQGRNALPLALTSTKGWQRRLRKRWKQLHRMVFLAGLLALVHYAWLVKDIRTPLRFGMVFALLLVLRIPRVRRAASRGRHWLGRRLHAA